MTGFDLHFGFQILPIPRNGGHGNVRPGVRRSRSSHCLRRAFHRSRANPTFRVTDIADGDVVVWLQKNARHRSAASDPGCLCCDSALPFGHNQCSTRMRSQ